MPSDIRRLNFIIRNATADDLAKLRQTDRNEKDQVTYLIYGMVNSTTVHGFAITWKNPRGLSKWRQILSAKTKEQRVDFLRDEDRVGKQWDQAYYEGLGNVQIEGTYISQGKGKSTDRIKQDKVMDEACDAVQKGAKADDLVLKDHSLNKRKKELQQREWRVTQDAAEKDKRALAISQNALNEVEQKIDIIIQVNGTHSLHPFSCHDIR